MADGPDKEEKTESATPRRLQESREKGQVPMSQEFIAAVMLIAGLGALLALGQRVAGSVGSMTVNSIYSLPTLGTDVWSGPDVARLLEDAAMPTLKTVAWCFAPIALIGLLVGYAQIGFEVTPKAIAMDLSKLNPTKGFGRLFSSRAVVRTAMALIKIILISTTVCAVAYSQIENVIRLGNTELGPMLAAMGRITFHCTVAALITILLLSLIDVIYQRYQHQKDMMMTKQEVKEEHRTSEGDPQVKARIRRVQIEVATRRMMDDVPSASVVITNPTHFAVALRYDSTGEGSSVPIVVAKGREHVALRIREVAREAGVVIYEDPPLARALYAQVEVGDEIPEDFYAAVATVLSYVYRLQNNSVSV